MVKETPGGPAGDPRPVGGWSDVSDAGADVTWGVGAVSDRLGVAASTLRTWERRYGVGPSHRTHGGHRRYAERDISRVELVRRMVARGVSAQDAARVARHLDGRDLASALVEEAPHTSSPGASTVVDSLLAAATAADEARLHELADHLLSGARALDVWGDVFSPTLARMAHETSRGTLAAEAELLATHVLLEHLGAARGTHATSTRPQVVLASTGPDTHALPFVAVGAALHQADVGLRLLDPDRDTREVLDLVSRVRPSVVLLWDPPGETGALVQRHLQADDQIAFMRASSGWPHELRLRLGGEATEIGTDVGGLVRHVLDRVV